MKRRDFLAATALALAMPTALAAEKPKNAAARKKPQKAMPAAAGAQTSARNSVLVAAPKGSSATYLPPAKAPALPEDWHAFVLTFAVQMPVVAAPLRLWLPLPKQQEPLYQRNPGLRWQGNFSRCGLHRLPDGELEAFFCDWPEGVAPHLEIVATLATADRVFDASRRTQPPERDDILRQSLRETAQLPNAGAARELALRIVGRIIDPLAQARALFFWVADKCVYDPALPPCGMGDVRAQIDAQRYGGRSADINGLFVALCRAIGIPARRVFGQRLGPSRLAACLGVEGEDVTAAAHCRAEFYVPGYAWIPADPGDMCRVLSLEKPAPENERALRRVLFGVWEMNWLAYNHAESPILPDLPDDTPVPPFFVAPRLTGPGAPRDAPEAAEPAYHIRSNALYGQGTQDDK
ncbi:MAG: transglutaminase-like domain-containing protein [Zoogloeaceae bacterium]|jgi:transglutaminase-like putative cysteine protease|nr:transglutaminase-like domain-containing protein [Zoogloeaceae bacterium]